MKLVMAKNGYKKVGDKYLLAKKCTKCGKWLVASTFNFHRNNCGRYGLESQCKKCRNKKNERWRLENKGKMTECRNRWYENNKEKVAEYHKQYCEANKKMVVERRKQYYQDNKEKIAEHQKQYYKNNKEKILEHQKQYNKQYYQENREKKLEYIKQYRQTPQGQIVEFNKNQRRRLKEEQQGTGITKDQWLDMMKFFGFRCAYSGETLTKDTRSVDHIVPLDAGGDNMIWNCVPMLRKLNSSKSTKDMEKWYKEQSFYSEARLQKIYDWQEYAYNKYGKDTQYFNSGNIQIKLI